VKPTNVSRSRTAIAVSALFAALSFPHVAKAQQAQQEKSQQAPGQQTQTGQTQPASTLGEISVNAATAAAGPDHNVNDPYQVPGVSKTGTAFGIQLGWLASITS
jgi:iron complex outermembrane receptor protein